LGEKKESSSEEEALRKKKSRTRALWIVEAGRIYRVSTSHKREWGKVETVKGSAKTR